MLPRQQQPRFIMYNVEEVKRLANGRWFDIFAAAGLNIKNKKHSACPICGGKDRFRADDKNGDGTSFCNNCGSNDGLGLLDLYMRGFKPAIEFVAGYLGISEETNIDQSAIDARKAETAAKNKLRAQYEADQKLEAQSIAANGASLIMQHSIPHSGHDYLTTKQIAGKTAWFMPNSFIIPISEGRTLDIIGSLIIPVINERRELVNVQIIKPDGFKMFLLDAQITGAFHLIGSVRAGDTILIGEGYATMDTIRAATSMPCVVGFNSNNLHSVSLIIDNLYPANKKLIIADNDWHNNHKPCGNVGLIKGMAAAKAINSDFISPPAIEGISDFNDYDVKYGRIELLNLLFRLKLLDSVRTNY